MDNAYIQYNYIGIITRTRNESDDNVSDVNRELKVSRMTLNYENIENSLLISKSDNNEV